MGQRNLLQEEERFHELERRITALENKQAENTAFFKAAKKRFEIVPVLYALGAILAAGAMIYALLHRAH